MSMLERAKDMAVGYRRAADEQYGKGDPMHGYCMLIAAALEELINDEISGAPIQPVLPGQPKPSSQ